MDSFHVLHNDHDRIDVVNRGGNDVSVKTHCHGSHINSFHNENVNKEKLPHGLHTDFLPRHVAIIMDGNSRWATQKGLQRSAGHEAGVETLKLIVELSAKWGVQALTVFGFSTENWNRPKVLSFSPHSNEIHMFQYLFDERFDMFDFHCTIFIE